jgi:hypothetical protein
MKKHLTTTLEKFQVVIRYTLLSILVRVVGVSFELSPVKVPIN